MGCHRGPSCPGDDAASFTLLRRAGRATSSTKPPPRETRRQSAGRQRRLCREASAAVLRRGPPFRNRSSVCRAPEIGTHATTPTMLPIRILQLCPAVYLHLSPKRCCEQKIHLAAANV